jgi:hypothetical protein
LRLRFDASLIHITHTSFVPFSSLDDALFRRIPVLIDCAGNIYLTWFNFYELTRHAIFIFTGEDPSNTTEVDVDPYKVTFFYTDIDGDKTMIAFDSDLEQAVRQFKQKGGLKIFANVQSVQDLPEAPPTEGPTSCESTQTTAAASLSPNRMSKELQEMVAAVAAAAAAAAVTAVWEEPSTNATKEHASDSVPSSENRNTGDWYCKAPSTAAHSVPFIYSANNTSAHSAPFIYSANTRGDRFRTAPIIAARFNTTEEQDGDNETAASMPEVAPITAVHSIPFIYSAANTAAHSAPFIYSANNTCDRFRTAPIIAARFDATKEQDGDDEMAASMPELTPLKNYETTCKQAGMSDETACEKEQDGNSDQQESDTAAHSIPFIYSATNSAAHPIPFIYSANDTAAHSAPFIYSANNTRDRFRTAPIIAARFNATNEQDGDDETAASMPGLTPLKNNETTCKQAKMSDETACEKEQAGNSDQQESEDTSDDSMPRLVLRPSRSFYPTDLLVTSTVPKEMGIESKGDVLSSFASDVEGRAESNAQAIEIMHLTSVEDLKKEIVAEAVKDEKSVDEDEDSLISQLGEDSEDDCSYDGWDVVVAVSDHSDDEESRD